MIRSACRTAIAIATLASSVSGPNAAAQQRALPTVQYQTEWYNEISTKKMQLKTITLITDVAAPVESAKRLILPYVKGCSPVQKEPTSGVYYSVCVPTVNSNLIEIGKILARLEQSEGSNSVRYDIHLFDPQFPDAEQTATYDEIVEMRPPLPVHKAPLVGGAYVEGVAIGFTPIAGGADSKSYRVGIVSNYDWVGPQVQCQVASAKTLPVSGKQFNGIVDAAAQQMRNMGAKVTDQGRFTYSNWMSGSVVGQLAKNGRPHQSYYRAIVWPFGGTVWQMTVSCDLALDTTDVKIADIVNKRLVIVHPDIGVPVR